MTIRFLIALLSLSLSFWLLAGCTGNDMAKNSEPGMIDSARLPDSEVADARIYLYDRGQVTAEIFANRIRKFEDIDSTVGYKLDIVFYDSLGLVTSTVVGDSGVIRETTGLLNIFGSVVVLTADSSRLETDYLLWDQKTQKIRTDAFVRITDIDGNVITGWGMEADRNLVPFKILRQVSGTVEETSEGFEQ